MTDGRLARAAGDDRDPTGSTGFDRVHVVTVTYNSASTLDRYFDGLRASKDAIAGVTVVDNSSADDSAERARATGAAGDLDIVVIENANTGFAGGYAAASRRGLDAGVPVLCLNPDVILAPGAIGHLLDVLNSFPDAGVVTMPLVETDGTPDTASRRTLPTLHGSMIYSVLGRLTPGRLRYNARETVPTPSRRSLRGLHVSELEATTGALMLVNPAFRTLDQSIFDRDYWMYGEDLQLCADAAAAGFRVLMAETAPSVHVKGVSSGRPRSTKSNRAFHDAMLLYATKNLVRAPAVIALLRVAIAAHFVLTELRAVPDRLRKSRARRRQ